MTDMERNSDREWYDRGYSLAKSEATRDSAMPILLGAWTLAGAMYFDQLVAIAFLTMYSLFKIQEYRDAKGEAESKREHYDPGKRYQ